MVLQRYWQPEFQNHGFIKKSAVMDYAERLIKQYDVRSGQGPMHDRPQHVRRQPAEGHHRPRGR